MWKTIKWLLTTIWATSFGFAIYLFYAWLKGEELKNLPRFLALLSANKYFFVAGLVVLGVLALVAFHKDAYSSLQDKVGFYKSTFRLRPTDINPSRAWFDPYYISRPTVAEVSGMLAARQGAVLVGVPLLGKTRCAYEVLKSLRGHYVLSLPPEKQDVAAIKIPRSYMLFKPKLVLFLDDLQRYVEKFSPIDLCRHLQERSSSFTVLATCRAGEELATVLKDQSFGSFVNQNLTVVELPELTKEQERTLASHFKREWTETTYNGTPGSIVFGLDVMRHRLHNACLEVKTLMRSLYLMRASGIQTFQRALVESVAEKIYGLQVARHVSDSAWRWLKDAGFLSLKAEQLIPTHAIYIESKFYPDYEIGDTPKDTAALWELVSVGQHTREVLEIALYSGVQGDYQMAEKGFRRYLKLLPNDAPGHYNLGVTLGKLGQMEEEKNLYKEAIRLDPNFAPAHYNLGWVLAERDQKDEAEREYREAIRCNPTDADSHCGLGWVLQHQGRSVEAEMEFRESIRYNPENDQAHYNLGWVLDERGQIEAAEKEFRETIRCNPDYAEAHYNLGVTLVKQGQFDEVETQFREAIRCNPDYAQAHFNLGVALVRQGRTDEAEKEFNEAKRLGFSVDS